MADDVARARLMGSGAASTVLTMRRSLAIPAATLAVSVPMRVAIENRRLLNGSPRASRVSFTHLAGFAIVRGSALIPAVNPHGSQVNLGVLADVRRSDGTRQVRAPTIKNAQELTFPDFCQRNDELVRGAREQSLAVSDSIGATVVLTNPGPLGTTYSVPRLMPGQSLMIGMGAVEFPPAVAGMPPDLHSDLAVSEVAVLTATYDTNVLSEGIAGRFVNVVAGLLSGRDPASEAFYADVFGSCGAGVAPFLWARDGPVPDAAGRLATLVRAYQQHRHGAGSHGDLGFSRLGFTVWDLPRVFSSGSTVAAVPLRDILRDLRQAYCR